MLVFSADLHLAPCAWKSMPKVYGDSYASYKQLVQYCLEHKPQALVLGGDVFDTHPDPVTVRVFLDGVWALRDAGIPVLAVQGQHGRDRVLPWTRVIEYVVELEGRPLIELGNFRIQGFDNKTPVELERALKTLDPRTNVLVLHQACKGALNERNGQQCWDLDPELVPPHIGIVLMGDIHKEWQTWLPPRGDHKHPTMFYYSGSLSMQSIDETPAKSFIVVNDNFSIDRIPLKTRVFESVELKFTDEIEAPDAKQQCQCNQETVLTAVDLAKNLPEDALFLVRYDPRLENVEEIVTKANPNIHIMFKLVPIEAFRSEPAADLRAATLKECLDQVIDREKDPDFHSFVLDLLQTKSPVETLSTYRGRMIGLEEPN